MKYTIKGLTLDFRLKKDAIQQKGRQVPIYFQKNSKERIGKINRKGTFGKSGQND